MRTRLRSWGETSEASAGRVAAASGAAQDVDAHPHVDDRGDAMRGRRPPTATPPHAWRPARFMVIAAHPDDAEFGPAGTAARWIDAGLRRAGSSAARAATRAARTRRGPARAGRPARARAAGGRGRHRLRGRDLPPPARRRARQRPRPARAARPRDPDLPAGRGPRDGSRRRSSTATAASTTPTIAPPGMAAVDAVYPAARNPMAFPALARARPRGASGSGGSTCSGRTGRTPGSTSRSTLDRKIEALRAHASQIQRPGGARRPDPRVGRRGGRADRRRRRRGAAPASSSTTTRTRGPASSRCAGQAPSRSSGRTRPHSFQRSARPSARRPSSATSSPRLRSPAVAARCSSAATVTSRRGRPSRPRSASVRIRIGSMPGVAERQRQVALRRDALVDEPAEPVEPVPERRQRLGDLAVLDAVNVPQNGWSAGKSQGAGLDADRDDARRPARSSVSCQRRGPPGRRRRAARRARSAPPRSPRTSRKIVGVPAAAEGGGERLVLVARSTGRERPLGPAARRAGGGWSAPRRRRPLVALGERLAGREAGRLGGLGGDPRGVRLERQPLERGADGRRPPRVRASPWPRRPRAALLMSLISVSQSRAAASASSVDCEPLYAARNWAWAASFSRRTARGSAPPRRPRPRRHVLVVGALGRRHRLGGLGRAGPRPDREPAAFGGDPPLAGARSVVEVAPAPPPPAPTAVARGSRRASPLGRSPTADPPLAAVGRRRRSRPARTPVARARRIGRPTSGVAVDAIRSDRREDRAIRPASRHGDVTDGRPPGSSRVSRASPTAGGRAGGHRGGADDADAGPDRTVVRRSALADGHRRLVDAGGRPGRRGPARGRPWRRRRRTGSTPGGGGSRPPRRSRGPRAERADGPAGPRRGRRRWRSRAPRPRARKANSLAVTLPASLGFGLPPSHAALPGAA